MCPHMCGNTSDEKLSLGNQSIRIREYPRVKPEGKHRMRFSLQKQTVNKLLSQRTAWKNLTMVLSVSLVFLSIAVFCRNEKTILVPAPFTKSFWVQGDEVSKEYLEEMGVYISKLLLDLSPGNVVHNHKALLRYASPEAYGSLKKQFLKEEENYTSLQLSTHFKPTSVTANPQTLNVEVKGILTSYVASKEIKTSSEVVFLKFTSQGSGLLLERATGMDQGEEE